MIMRKEGNKMGRYYSGDIEGKFWFAIQSSTAADRFGVTGREPNYLNYYFDKEDLHRVQEELKDIEKELGHKLKTLQNYFAGVNSFNGKDLEQLLLCTKQEAGHYIKEYADYTLGKKIEACIIRQGSCDFDAEI